MSGMALVNIVTIGVDWAISISWFSISFTLVNRLGWAAKDSPSNVRGTSIRVVSKGTRVFHLGWSILHFHGLTLMDVVTSVLLTVLVRASMSGMALVDIVTIGVDWAVSVSWLCISFSF